VRVPWLAFSVLAIGAACAASQSSVLASRSLGGAVAAPGNQLGVRPVTPTATPAGQTGSGAGPTAVPAATRIALGRGINLANALEAPKEGEWGMTIEEKFFGLVRAAGFDHVRIPIRWSANTANAAPYIVYPDFFSRIDTVVNQALAADLKVVVDVHHFDEIFSDPDGHEARFIAIWQQIARRYKGKAPSLVAYEPLNEPHDALSKAKWTALATRTLTAIRAIDPQRTIILDGDAWGGVPGLDSLEMPDDPLVMGSFHFYEPMLFTHQGAAWVGKEHGTLGVSWPGPPALPISPVADAVKVAWAAAWFKGYNSLPAVINPAGSAAVADSLDRAARWSARTGHALYMGEFGAYEKGDYQSRVKWTRVVRQEAERRGIRDWAYWEFGAGFGAYDRDKSAWRQELLAALTPGATESPPPPPGDPATTTRLDLRVYDDRLRAGWADWSWDSDVDLGDLTRLDAGAAAIAWKPRKAWAGLYFHADSPVPLTGHASVGLRLQATANGQAFNLVAYDEAGKPLPQKADLADHGGTPQIGRWTAYVVPLSALGAANRTISGLAIQDRTGAAQPLAYVDEIGLIAP
jgi:endoglucanase